MYFKIDKTQNCTIIPVRSSSKERLERISLERSLALSLSEMLNIQKYFIQIGRDITDIEIETISQTWSEHCKHKTLTSEIDYKTDDTSICPSRIYQNLLKETIFQTAETLQSPLCLSVFEDNAGIIAFDKEYGLAFKVETHNHPSAIEPYGGSSTGLGGVIRDILGVGLGAKPLINTDVFCFGNLSTNHQYTKSIHPKRIHDGVIAGVRDYGNKIGIPTVNGAVSFRKEYNLNPLVFCGCLGKIPISKIDKEVQVGDHIVCIGGKTGYDGIHGATNSSISLNESTEKSMVQIGNPLIEKKVLEVILTARDKHLYSSITDCGAGGFSSSIGELAIKGAKVHLEQASLKHQNMNPWEIWISESQERMILSVPSACLEDLKKICQLEEIECDVLGEFTDSNYLEIFYNDKRIAQLDTGFLHHGLGKEKKYAVWNIKTTDIMHIKHSKLLKETTIEETIKKILSHPDVASKEYIVRQYDHEVQGKSVLSPFSGPHGRGPNDASVSLVHFDSVKGVVVSNGLGIMHKQSDPYWMAAQTIDESLRNLVSVGGTIQQCALLDNFCWGDVNNPLILGELVRCIQGCHDASIGFKTPFISGKDSLNNTFKKDTSTQSIPGTLLISAVGIIEDIHTVISSDLKKEGNNIYILGETTSHLLGSIFEQIYAVDDGLSKMPKVNWNISREKMLLLSKAIQNGWIASCHDVSDGGMVTTISEMCIGGDLGVDINLHRIDMDIIPYFVSENAGRWLLEIDPQYVDLCEKHFKQHVFHRLGQVKREKFLSIHEQNHLCVDIAIEKLKEWWTLCPQQ